MLIKLLLNVLLILLSLMKWWYINQLQSFSFFTSVIIQWCHQGFLLRSTVLCFTAFQWFSPSFPISLKNKRFYSLCPKLILLPVTIFHWFLWNNSFTSKSFTSRKKKKYRFSYLAKLTRNFILLCQWFFL